MSLKNNVEQLDCFQSAMVYFMQQKEIEELFEIDIETVRFMDKLIQNANGLLETENEFIF